MFLPGNLPVPFLPAENPNHPGILTSDQFPQKTKKFLRLEIRVNDGMTPRQNQNSRRIVENAFVVVFVKEMLG